jgi:hypothetical protein
MAYQLTRDADITALQIALKERALASLQNEAMFAPGGPLFGLMWVKDLPLGSKSDQFNRMNSLTAIDITDGIDMATSERLSPTGTAVTATETICITTITDYAKSGSIDDLAAHAGEEMGFAMATKWDTDVMALHNGFDTDSGTTGTDTTMLMLQQAVGSLYKNKHPGPYWAVIHPNQWQHLMAETAMTIGSSTGGFGTIEENVMGSYWMIGAPLMGCNIMVSNNVPNANSGEDHSGAVYSRNPAVGCVIQTEPRARRGRWITRMNLQVDESLRAEEAVCTSSYGVAEIDGTAANGLETDLET